MIVQRIDKGLAQRIVAAKHYSRRLGIFWEGYGLYDGAQLLGVCCFGQPSAPIQKHAFKDRDFRLYELTRLVVERGVKNGASILIAGALKQLTVQPAATRRGDQLRGLRARALRHRVSSHQLALHWGGEGA